MRLSMRRALERGTVLAVGLGSLCAGACGSSQGSTFRADPQNASGAGGVLSFGSGGRSAAAGAPDAPDAESAATKTGTGGTSSTCVGAGCGVGPNPGGKPAEATCGAPGECASGRCEPVTGVAKTVCLGACFADGVACAKALDCCSTGCHGGVCGGLCTLEGDSCKTNADCCSHTCKGGRCAIDEVNRDCRPTGEDCTSGTGRGCCNECNRATKRCAFGADTCFAEGVTCTADSDCCRGACTAGVCKTPCAENGTACTQAGDCCSVNCAAGTCATKTPPDGGPACAPTGAMCASAAECCSAFCFGGFCEPPIR